MYGAMADVYIEASLGSTKTLPFQLRRKGTVFNWNVSAASQITFQFNRAEEPAMIATMASDNGRNTFQPSRIS